MTKTPIQPRGYVPRRRARIAGPTFRPPMFVTKPASRGLPIREPRVDYALVACPLILFAVVGLFAIGLAPAT